MIIDINYWMKVFKKILIFVLSILGLFIAFKFVIFYIPFLIAFIISLIIEPIIRYLMRKFKLTRRTSSVIVFIISLSIIIGLLSWGIISLVTESYNLLNNLNNYISLISGKFQNLFNKIDLERWNLPNEFIGAIQNQSLEIVSSITEWARGVLTNLLEFITSIPTMIIYTVITILALFFICTDKIYMIDLLEHHLPKKWVKKLTKFIKEISNSLGLYLKAQIILIFISFCICLSGLLIFKIVGLNIEFPLLIALVIGFVDALPIFGSSAAMVPWAVITAINGDLTLAVSILILLGIMSFTRQMLEPKIVSGKLGVHPIFTLIAMYTGFKIIGVLGMLLGPIVLIILKNIFGTMLDKGLVKSIFERE